MNIAKISKRKFYILNFTWGIALSFFGVLICGALVLCGYKLKRHGYCYYIEIGDKKWGGLEFGWFFLANKNASEYTKNHELGHGYQNCKYGFAMPIFWVISACRYWAKNKFGVKLDYYGWFYEKEATDIGFEAITLTK